MSDNNPHLFPLLRGLSCTLDSLGLALMLSLLTCHTPPLYAVGMSLVILGGMNYLSRQFTPDRMPPRQLLGGWLPPILFLILYWSLRWETAHRLTSLLFYLLAYLLCLSLRYWGERYFLSQAKAQLCSNFLRRKTIHREMRRFDRILFRFVLALLSTTLIIVVIDADEWLQTAYLLPITLMSWGIFGVESFYISWMERKLRREQWVPVLRADGTQITYHSTQDIEHSEGILPIVRLIVFSEKMIYLEQNSPTYWGAGGEYDTPFVAWQEVGQEATQIAQGLIDERFCGVRRIAIPTPIYYTESYQGRRWRIALFAIEIEEPKLLHIDCKPLQGKWYPMQELKPQIDTPIFSPYLRSELPLLEETILLAGELHKRKIKDDN